MSFFSLLGAVEIGLIFSLVALGVFISFRLLRFPRPHGGWQLSRWRRRLRHSDFHRHQCLGIYHAGCHGGWRRGRLITGLAQRQAQDHGPAGQHPDDDCAVFDQPAHHGRAQRALINDPTLFVLLQPEGMQDYIARPLILAVIVVAAKLLLDWFFATERGLAIRATGSNARMARAQGVNTGAMLLLGMAISNGLVGLAGALFAQTQGGSDISMGIGTIVIGLAAVIVGEHPALAPPDLCHAGGHHQRHRLPLLHRLALNSDFIGLKAQT